MTTRAAHDRLHFYRKNDLPAHAHVAAVDIDDPYAQAGRKRDDGTVDVEARLEPFRHRDGSTARGAPGWTPPPHPRITVVQSLKNDPLGHMRARRQIDKAQYQAGRDYQTLHTKACSGHVTSLDPTRTFTNFNGHSGTVTDDQRRCAELLRIVHIAVAKYAGHDALMLMRDVLAECMTIERAVRHRFGVSTVDDIARREMKHWGWLFRRTLDVAAFKLGHASSPRKIPPRQSRAQRRKRRKTP